MLYHNVTAVEAIKNYPKNIGEAKVKEFAYSQNFEPDFYLDNQKQKRPPERS